VGNEARYEVHPEPGAWRKLLSPKSRLRLGTWNKTKAVLAVNSNQRAGEHQKDMG